MKHRQFRTNRNAGYLLLVLGAAPAPLCQQERSQTRSASQLETFLHFFHKIAYFLLSLQGQLHLIMKIYLPLVVCTIIGVMLLFWSSQYPRYADQKMFDAAYSELGVQLRNGELTSNEASNKFYEIRDRYQTLIFFFMIWDLA